MSQERVALTLGKDEALVLWEFLSRFSSEDRLNIEHQAEERVLWDLQSSLEKEFVEVLDSDYRIRLAEARKRAAANSGHIK